MLVRPVGASFTLLLVLNSGQWGRSARVSSTQGVFLTSVHTLPLPKFPKEINFLDEKERETNVTTASLDTADTDTSISDIPETLRNTNDNIDISALRKFYKWHDDQYRIPKSKKFRKGQNPDEDLEKVYDFYGLGKGQAYTAAELQNEDILITREGLLESYLNVLIKPESEIGLTANNCPSKTVNFDVVVHHLDNKERIEQTYKYMNLLVAAFDLLCRALNAKLPAEIDALIKKIANFFRAIALHRSCVVKSLKEDEICTDAAQMAQKALQVLFGKRGPIHEQFGGCGAGSGFENQCASQFISEPANVFQGDVPYHPWASTKSVLDRELAYISTLEREALEMTPPAHSTQEGDVKVHCSKSLLDQIFEPKHEARLVDLTLFLDLGKQITKLLGGCEAPQLINARGLDDGEVAHHLGLTKRRSFNCFGGRGYIAYFTNVEGPGPSYVDKIDCDTQQ